MTNVASRSERFQDTVGGTRQTVALDTSSVANSVIDKDLDGLSITTREKLTSNELPTVSRLGSTSSHATSKNEKAVKKIIAKLSSALDSHSWKGIFIVTIA